METLPTLSIPCCVLERMVDCVDQGVNDLHGSYKDIRMWMDYDLYAVRVSYDGMKGVVSAELIRELGVARVQYVAIALYPEGETMPKPKSATEIMAQARRAGGDFHSRSVWEMVVGNGEYYDRLGVPAGSTARETRVMQREYGPDEDGTVNGKFL